MKHFKNAALSAVSALALIASSAIAGPSFPPGSGGGTPGGASNTVQYNNGGSFGGVGPGTATTLLHGNAAGAPTFSAVDLNAEVTGNLAVSHLNSGTGASSTTFWAGDGTWKTPAGGSGCTVSGTAGQAVYNNGTTGCLSSAATFSSGGGLTLPVAGAASTPGLTLSGAPFTGGSGTTTFPQLYLNSGTAPTTWATTGTAIGVNLPNASTANFLDFHVNGGPSVFSITSTGIVTASSSVASSGNVSAGSTGNLSWASRSQLKSPADGIVLLQNAANTDFTRLQFGGTTSSFPAIKRSLATLSFRLADDSADANISAAGATFSGPINGDATNLINIPVANATGILPAANGGAGAVSGIMQANGSGLVAAATLGNGLSYSSPKLSLTNCLNNQTGTSYAVAATDAACIVTAKNVSAMGFTLVQANSAGFTSGYGTTLANINAPGGTNLTLTATTSIFGNGLTTLVLAPGQVGDIGSNGTDYPFTAVSLPVMAQDTLLGNPNAANYPTAMTLPACASDGAHGLTYASHALACTAISGGAASITVNTSTITGGTTTRLPYNNAGTYGEIAGSGWNGTTLTLPALSVSGNVDLSGAANRNINLNATSEIDVGGSSRIAFAGGGMTFGVFSGWGTSGGGVGSTTATATTPSLFPNYQNFNTGWGAGAANTISCVISSVEKCRITAEGVQYKQATAPVPTGTGSPTIATGSTDEAGEVTSGTSATSVIITFNLSHTNAPFCVVTAQPQISSFAYTLSNTAITITQTATSAAKIDYRCTFP